MSGQSATSCDDEANIEGPETPRLSLDALLKAIEVDIVFGIHPGGARLTEDTLMVRSGAKRHLVREALSQLEAKGYVTRVPNRGAIVTELTPRQVDEIYQVRFFLETAAARITLLPAPDAIVVELDALQRAHAQAVETEAFRDVFAFNIQFHAAQFALCGNSQLIGAIEDFSRRAHLIRAVKYGDRQHMRTVADQHRAMVLALQGTDVEAYVATVADHLPASAIEYRKHYARRFGHSLDG